MRTDYDPLCPWQSQRVAHTILMVALTMKLRRVATIPFAYSHRPVVFSAEIFNVPAVPPAESHDNVSSRIRVVRNISLMLATDNSPTITFVRHRIMISTAPATSWCHGSRATS
jgi:hypothetical protein